MNEELIRQAYQEDIPNGDTTTDSLNIKEKFGCARLVAKQDLILSGKDLFESCVLFCDSEAQIHWLFSDGGDVLEGQTVAEISGNLISLIKAERVALNFLGSLCGIATLTQSFVKACGNSKTKILDTRKTTPLYRNLAKKAVLDGGGQNHRMNLSDAILIKENHIAIAGGFKEAIDKVRNHSQLPIEVEAKNFQEVQWAVEKQVARIMFDNMNLEEMAQCLEIVPENIETEASGNMTLDRVPAVAELGVRFISVGALTHSAPTADFSLLFDWS